MLDYAMICYSPGQRRVYYLLDQESRISPGLPANASSSSSPNHPKHGEKWTHSSTLLLPLILAELHPDLLVLPRQQTHIKPSSPPDPASHSSILHLPSSWIEILSLHDLNIVPYSADPQPHHPSGDHDASKEDDDPYTLQLHLLPAREFNPNSVQCQNVLDEFEILLKRAQVIHPPPGNQHQDYGGFRGLLTIASTPAFQAKNPVFMGVLHAFLRHAMSDPGFDLDALLTSIQTAEGLDALPFTPSPIMLISPSTLSALGVFASSSSNINSPYAKVTCPCLLTTLDKTRTKGGRALLSAWLRYPSLDLTVLRERQRTISWAIQHRAIAKRMADCLSHVKGMNGVVSKLALGTVTLSEWQNILLFCYYGLQLKFTVDEVVSGTQKLTSSNSDRDQKDDLNPWYPTLFHAISETFHIEAMECIATRINDTVDFDATSHHTAVKPGISTILDGFKHTLARLDHRLTREAQTIGQQCPFPDAQVVYFPQIGFLIALDLPSILTVMTQHQISGNEEQHDLSEYGLEFRFAGDDDIYYYKSDDMYGLDEEIGDLHSLIVDKELEIIHSLTLEVYPLASTYLSPCIQLTSQVDVLLALADVALQNQWVEPHLVQAPVLEIRDGRHPWLETLVPFIANDTLLNGQTRSLVITGANSSGKSVYLKQVALITLLAHIGSRVPASHATLGLTDKILLRTTSTGLTCSGDTLQSSFRQDLKQINDILHHATDRSLVLVDEFGQGTTALDGIGLFVGTLKRLSKTCRRVVSATHFHEIFTFNLLPLDDTSPFQHASMSILEDSSPAEGIEEEGADAAAKGGQGLTFLYRLVPGQSGQSWGFHVAKLAGIPANILNRGQHISACLATHQCIPKVLTPDQKEQQQKDAHLFRVFMGLHLKNNVSLTEFWKNVIEEGQD